MQYGSRNYQDGSMKHTLNKTKKDLLGQYMTVNADKILKNFRGYVIGRNVVDPCAGHGDLLRWARDNWANEVEGFDIEPQGNDKFNDMYKTPVDCYKKLVVTNPPYLSSNRAVDKTPYKRWGQSDLYKCYLATLMESKVEQAIIIQPSNFLCESNSKAREMLFENYSITYAEHWQEEIFDKVAIGIMVMHIKREKKDIQRFEYLNRTTGVTTYMKLEGPSFLHGPEELIDMKDYIRFQKLDIGMDPPNSKIIVSLLDKGKYQMGFHVNEGEDIYNKPTSFTTYQINTPDDLTAKQHFILTKKANFLLRSYRNIYNSMFLSNYIDYNQKILSRSIANKILTKIYPISCHVY